MTGVFPCGLVPTPGKVGKAALSEMMLFYEAGFAVEDILQIVTINGARAIGLEAFYGSVEMGKRADRVLFEENPFQDYQNSLGGLSVVKDGVVDGR